MAEDAKGIDSDLIRGHIDTIILKVLKTGDRYGYEIIKDVETKSQGTYELKQPTLYSCLKRLEGQGLISSYWTDSDIGGKRHYYKLTEKGEQDLERNQNEWLKSRSIIDSLIYETAPSSPVLKEETKANNSQDVPNTDNSTIEINGNESSSDASDETDDEEEILNEIQDDLGFVQSIYDDNLEDQIEEIEQSSKENVEQLEIDHFALQEAEQKRILAQLESEPTPLEMVTELEKQENQSIEDEDYEFSTFADETRRQKEMARQAQVQQEQQADAEVAEERRQRALDILFSGSNDFSKNINDTTIEKIEEEDKQIQEPSTSNNSEQIVEPTYEQKQALKLFEGNKVTGNFTESTYKNKLNELSSLIVRSKPETAQISAQKVYKGVEYNPQDTNFMKRKFEDMGIMVRVHHKLERVKEEKTHLLKNKIRLARSWITFGTTSVLLALSLIILCSTKLVDMSAKNALPLYLPAFAILLAFPVVTTIVYWCDPQKRVPARYAPRISIISSCLFFIQALVITYAINLQTGFVSFRQSGYNHLGWIVPTIASVSILVSTISYYFLYKSKKFHS